MILEIDFNSDEALYIQLRNQIVIGIATSQLSAGDSLPSVRQLADRVGINMHTVNKAYTVLRQEGYVKLDRRKGAVIAIDCNKASARNKLLRDLQVMLAGAMCKGITRDEVHEMIDMIYDYYEQPAIRRRDSVCFVMDVMRTRRSFFIQRLLMARRRNSICVRPVRPRRPAWISHLFH